MRTGFVLKIAVLSAVVAGLGFGPLQLLDARRGSRAAPVPTAPTAVRRVAVAEVISPPARTKSVREHAARIPVKRQPRQRPLLTAVGNRGANFVSVCAYSHSAPDDPIVFPNQPGASHMHDFLGNASTNANSTYESLQATNETSCKRPGDTAAYWVPALYDSGKRVLPTMARIYYLPGQKSHTTVQPFPKGLEVVAKDANVRVGWACVGKEDIGRSQPTPPTCPAGTHLVQRIRFPDCWDGRNVDSPDHTSHMTFARNRGCPNAHRVPVPAISLNVHYPTDGGDIVLGSPQMPVKAHADFFNAWDQPTLERLVRTCINTGIHCGARGPNLLR
jgi:uncharacterized protein DUF1996